MNLAAEQLDFVIFDCDGVVVDSNQLKSDGFVAALQGQPQESVDDFLIHHKQNGGISRFVKFRRYFTEVISCSDPEAAIEDALQMYADFLGKALPEAELIPGAVVFLNKLSELGTRLFMISGGKETEVQWLMREKGLARHFQQILGSPITKLEHLSNLESKQQLLGSGIYFGDGAGDWHAAQKFNIPFCFVSDASEWNEGREMARQGIFPSVSDLTHISVQ